MEFARPKSLPYTFIASMLALATHAAQATEGGGSSYPMGSDNWVIGAIPPPGLYTQIFASHYEADTLKDNRGNELPVDFSVRADALSPRLIWVTDQQILGGSLAFHTIMPLVDMRVSVNGNSQNKRGLGDMFFGGALGFHHSEKLHSLVALDVIAPTGEYDKNDIANIGRNYWVVEPVFAASYIDKTGFNADIKVMYDFNMENQSTDYRSGQEFHFDYSAGWAVTPSWVVGVGGYFYRQTTDDKQDGETLSDNKGRAFAIGPSIKYDSNDGWFLSAKWQQESSVRNRAEGDAYWLKLTIPL
ncbi:hypothetical protein D3C85_549780 [compost metagenome]